MLPHYRKKKSMMIGKPAFILQFIVRSVLLDRRFTLTVKKCSAFFGNCPPKGFLRFPSRDKAKFAIKSSN